MIANSTKYAIKALLFLASIKDGQFIQVGTLSEKTGVPGPYLSKLMKQLATKNIVSTKRGASGGVKVSSKDITLLEICEAIGEPILNADCFLNAAACDREAPCPFHNEWGSMRTRFLTFLHQSTLRKYSSKLAALLKD